VKYLVEATKHTPFVHLSVQKKIIQIEGVSHPENALSFYLPVIESLKQLAGMKLNEPFEMKVFMDYFNTSSAKCLFDIFKQISRMKKQGMEIIIHWNYEEDDEDMLETGEDYADLLNLDFQFIALPYARVSSI
jgi:hypothetical protein